MLGNLTAGQDINPTETNPDLEKIFVGLGWDVNESYDESQFDLDAAAFMISKSGTVSKLPDIIFYGNLEHPTGAVTHTGDNRTGRGEGDDEAILVDLSKIPEDIEKIAFTASIYEADERKQTFGQVNNSFIRFYDEDNGELFRYDLDADFSTETAVIFGELVRSGSQWKFNAIGKGFQGGMLALCIYYGVFKK